MILQRYVLSTDSPSICASILNLRHLEGEPAPGMACGGTWTSGRGCASGQQPKKGRHRSLCVQLLLCGHACGVSNVVEQVPQSRLRGTAPCTCPRTLPFLSIPSGASLSPMSRCHRKPERRRIPRQTEPAPPMTGAGLILGRVPAPLERTECRIRWQAPALFLNQRRSTREPDPLT